MRGSGGDVWTCTPGSSLLVYILAVSSAGKPLPCAVCVTRASGRGHWCRVDAPSPLTSGSGATLPHDHE